MGASRWVMLGVGFGGGTILGSILAGIGFFFGASIGIATAGMGMAATIPCCCGGCISGYFIMFIIAGIISIIIG